MPKQKAKTKSQNKTKTKQKQNKTKTKQNQTKQKKTKPNLERESPPVGTQPGCAPRWLSLLYVKKGEDIDYPWGRRRLSPIFFFTKHKKQNYYKTSPLSWLHFLSIALRLSLFGYHFMAIALWVSPYRHHFLLYIVLLDFHRTIFLK